MSLLPFLRQFFSTTVPLRPDETVVVAFSGGPDSTALLAALARLREPLSIRLQAAHLDHALDPGSSQRARQAASIAARLDVALTLRRIEVARRQRTGESREEAARRIRYGFLDAVRHRVGARWIVTAHHRDDQSETVLLRLLFGSGVEGLAAMAPVRGRILRPCLDLPRARLLELLHATGLQPARDPSNDDLTIPRNRIRQRLLPELHSRTGIEATDLARLARAADGARRKIRRLLRDRLDPRELPATPGASIALGELVALPEALKPSALAFLHECAGAAYPAGRAPRRELLRQMGRGGRIGCDCGRGWRWEGRGDRLCLVGAESAAAPFEYTEVA